MAKATFPNFLESEFKSYFITAYDLFLFAFVVIVCKFLDLNEVLTLLLAGAVAFASKLITSFLPRGYFLFFLFNAPILLKSLKTAFFSDEPQINFYEVSPVNFPIISVSDNIIEVRSGQKTKFFELTPPDLEQMSPDNQEAFLQDTIARLSRLNETSHYKFYFFNNKIFLSCEDSLPISSVELVPCSFPLLPFFNIPDAYTEILIFDDYFKAKLKYYRLISITSFPSTEISENTLMDYGNYTLSFQKIPKKKTETTLGKQISVNTLGSNSGKNDIISSKTYSQASNVLSEIIDGTLSYFNCEIAFWVEAETIFELNSKTESLSKNLIDDGFSILIESTGLNKVLYHSFPGVNPLFKNPLTNVRARKMPTNYLVNLLPLTQDKLDEDGISLYSRTGIPLTWNPLEKNAPNFNAIISGESGQGKSFLACALVEYFHKKNVKLIVLDKGQSFSRLARYYEASNFSSKFNPLQFKDPDYLKAFVMSVLPTKDFDERSEGIIYRIIKNSLSEEKLKSFDDLLLALSKEIPHIYDYFEEIRQYFTNDELSLPSFTYIDSTLIPKKLLAPMLIFLMKLTRSLTGTKRFVIDEAWDVLGKHSQYVAQMARESRKEGCGLITITQNLADFFRNGGDALAQVILENSNYKISLHQIIPECAQFSPHSEQTIKSLRSQKDEYSEFLIESNRSFKVARFVATYLQYELFNTEEDRKNTINKWLEDHLRYFSYAESMDRFVKVAYA